jgi:hypothetical protein
VVQKAKMKACISYLRKFPRSVMTLLLASCYSSSSIVVATCRCKHEYVRCMCTSKFMHRATCMCRQTEITVLIIMYMDM